ncbi:trypsin-like peptidase domain-containing protein [Amycolatopsis sp. NBC_01307]|uniref:trypsin-like peptidase domain-containing protein n=1 Tax=Amycolatopsis sp. NBC_01307 TaxID=2903561 RepID=UPI002E11ADA7|nr:trypsin-like peptidase domain-containing protein [Amycolatopsis sp. NBC_01307]
MLTAEGAPVGTCFQVSPGVLGTAWHVLRSMGSGAPGDDVLVDPLGGGTARSARVANVDPLHDLAVLTVAEPLDGSVSLVATDGRPLGLRIVITGTGQLDDPHYDYNYRFMETAGRWAGATLRDSVPLARVEAPALLLGMSGAPVRRQGDDAVVGIVSGRYNSADGWARDSVWVARVENLTPLLADLTGTVLDPLDHGGSSAAPLRAYLDDAVRAAQSHPYPGAVPHVPAPPLTTVYVHQQTERRAAGEGRLPADVVLDGDQDCLVTGGPGSGKSCLLRSALISAARQWDDGRTGRELPVRVLAADIAATPRIAEAIAASANVDLGGVIGRKDPLEAGFFAREPLPGVRWLVLVDGLDEVIDPARRRAVIDKVAGAAGPIYRFVVATRDLPDDELNQHADWRPHTYELLPFTAAQLPGFAQAWFAALSLTDPAAAAGHFVAEVQRASLSVQARNPLMATILCQLYARDPRRPLPPGRSEAFADYVDLLTNQPYEFRDGDRNPGGLAVQTNIALDRYGGVAVAAADAILARSLDDIGWLAAVLLEGAIRTAPELLAERTAGSRPGNVPEAVWQSFLRDLLRRSGVFIERADDFVFLHHTVTEFLAARYTVADSQRSADAFHDFTRQTREHRWSMRKSWDKPQGDSYARFLVAAWHDRDDLPATLRGLAARDLFGCVFVADLRDDRTAVDQTVVAAATRKLTALAGGRTADLIDRVLAMLTLTRLGEPSGEKMLSAVVDDAIAGRIDRRDVVWAIRIGMRLREHPVPRFAELLTAQATDPATEDVFRSEAMSLLVQVDSTQGAEVLLAGTHDLTLCWADRVAAAATLARRGDSRGTEALLAHTSDPGVTHRDRLAAAKTLAKLGDTRGADALVTQTENVPAADRLAAARTLVGLNDPRGVQALHTLTVDATVDIEDRRRAAGVLAELGDARGFEALVDQATGVGSDQPDRAAADACWRAARTLVALGDPRGTSLLAALETNPAMTVIRDRSWSAGEGLRSLGDDESDSGATRTARHDLLLINLKLAQQIGPSFYLVRRIWSLSIRDQSGLPFRARYVADLRSVQSWSTPSSIGRSTWAAPGPITWLTGLLVLVVPFAAWFVTGAFATRVDMSVTLVGGVVLALVAQVYVILFQRITFIVLFSKSVDPWPVFAFGWLAAVVAGFVFAPMAVLRW